MKWIINMKDLWAWILVTQDHSVKPVTHYRCGLTKPVSQ